MNIELLHFRFSPYNEKIRWALDLKELPHTRKSLLPGPHMGLAKRLTGQTCTPILRFGEDWVAGSGKILAALDDLHPHPRLFPLDKQERAQVEEIQERFDEDWTPRIRRVVIAALLSDGKAMVSVFAGHKRAFVRLPYACAFPLAKPLIAKGNGITGPESIEDGQNAIGEAMEFIADATSKKEFLVGDELTVADITAASTIATILDMTETPMQRPIDPPPLLAEANAKWRDHPGAVWVNNIFAKYRGAAKQPDGEILYT